MSRNLLILAERKGGFDGFDNSPRVTKRTIVPCLDCGKEIAARSKRCSKCAPSKKMKFKIPIPSKEEMRRLLMEKKLETLAKEFGVTRATFRKLINSMGLNTQPRGFFLKGKKWKKKGSNPLN
jgi:hypothetical protein